MTVPVPVVVGFAVGLILVLVLLLAVLFHTGPQGAGGAALDLGALRELVRQRKTQIGIVTIALNNYAARRGWIDGELCNTLNYVVGTLTAIAATAKMNRIENKTETAVTAAKIAAVKRPADDPAKEGI